MIPYLAVPQLVPVAPGPPPGGLNCNTAVAAACVAHATNGARCPSAEQVRALVRNPDGSPDRHGGTTLRQAQDAIRRGYAVDMDVRTPWAWAALREHAKRNPDCFYSVSVWYGAFRGTPAYASRSGFIGNHQVGVRWVAGEWEMYDPLADGRPGTPKAPVRVSDGLLARAAALLDFGVSRLGPGRVYVGIVRAPAPPPTRYSVRFAARSFWAYGATPRESVRFDKATSASCGAPSQRLFNGGERRAVRVSRGKLEGRYVEPGRDGVQLVETK